MKYWIIIMILDFLIKYQCKRDLCSTANIFTHFHFHPLSSTFIHFHHRVVLNDQIYKWMGWIGLDGYL